MRCPRAEVIDPGQVNLVHVYNRTVRRCFLMGHDSISGKNFDHRKIWIEDSLRHFAAFFGIDLLSYTILSNHFHLILRTRPDVVQLWDDHEVARRWLMICPMRKGKQGLALSPTEKEIRSIAGCPVRLAEIRQRLCSVSWWMRLLCQRVATRANREDQQTGRFFQDRYKATLLIDEASLLACSVYVDLNLIRAAICQTVEQSEHSSAQRRIAALVSRESKTEQSGQATVVHPDRINAADFLSPVLLEPNDDFVGTAASATSRRCSDKGFLPMTTAEYLELLDWTARQSAAGKLGKTPATAPPLLKRLGFSPADWLELTEDFGKLFSSVAGRCEHVDQLRGHRRGRRFYLRRRARELMSQA